jgi:hypothetical protein
MKKLIVAITLLIAAWKGFAQNVEDIVRISKTDAIGSARVLGTGGAWGAVGADLSSASINPAGLGFFRKNELVGSIAVTANYADASYMGSFRNDSRTNFNIPNIGAVFTYVNQERGKDAKTGWISASFAVGMNRTSDFQQNTFYSGINKNNSIGESLAQLSNNVGLDTNYFKNSYNFNDLRSLAWYSYLTNNVPNRSDTFDSWFGRYRDNNYSVNQTQTTQLRGRMNEWYFGVATNISNFLYLGASLVFNNTSITKTTSFTESINTVSVKSNPYLGSVYNTSTTTSGSGVGGRFGIILSPIDYFRIGLSYQTPIRVNLTDDYNLSLTTNLVNNSFNIPSGQFTSNYQILTPGKIALSGVIIIPQRGFISVDYEMTDYRDGQIKSNEFQSNFDKINTNARVDLTQASNLRIGGEYRWDNYRFRGGYNLINSPYADNFKSTKKQCISAGLGMLWGNGYFMDAACIRSWGTVYNSPYDEKQSSQIDLTKYTFMISSGIRF